jgi:hypothetical protein
MIEVVHHDDGYIGPPGGERGEFSVAQFFKNGTHEYVRRWVSAEEATKAFQHYTNSVGARWGAVLRVIITDGGDSTNAEWQHGKGLTYPTPDTPVESE